MKVLTANESFLGQRIRLLNANRAFVEAQVLDVESSSYDHVVRTTADLPTPSGGYIDLTSGSWMFAAPVAIGTDTLRVPAGQTVFLYGAGWTNILSGLTHLVEVVGICIANSLRMQTVGTGAGCFRLNGAGAILAASHCRMTSGGSGGSCVLVTLASQVNLFGGGMLSSSAGVWVAGSVDDLQVLGVSSRAVVNSVYYSAGTVLGCNVSGCCFQGTNGINWPAASMPTRGLCVVANDLNNSTPFNGFTAASARVNAKGNFDSAALMTETAIVP